MHQRFRNHLLPHYHNSDLRLFRLTVRSKYPILDICSACKFSKQLTQFKGAPSFAVCIYGLQATGFIWLRCKIMQTGSINPAKSEKKCATNSLPVLQSLYSSTQCTGFVPHNDVSVNDGPHIRRWSHNIIILFYNTILLQLTAEFSTVTFCTGL